jgi:hypothetical protein
VATELTAASSPQGCLIIVCRQPAGLWLGLHPLLRTSMRIGCRCGHWISGVAI